MTFFKLKVPANFVPAAAVIRGGQALFKMTGRKGHLGGLFHIIFIKYQSLTVVSYCVEIN